METKTICVMKQWLNCNAWPCVFSIFLLRWPTGGINTPVPLSVYIVTAVTLLLFALYVWWRIANGYSKREIEREKQNSREKAALLRQRLRILHEQGNSAQDIARLFNLREEEVLDLLNNPENETEGKTLAERINESVIKKKASQTTTWDSGTREDTGQKELIKPHLLFKRSDPFVYYENFVNRTRKEEIRRAKLKSASWGWAAFVVSCTTVLYGIAISLSWVDSAWYVWTVLPLLCLLLVMQWTRTQNVYRKKAKTA